MTMTVDVTFCGGPLDGEQRRLSVGPDGEVRIKREIRRDDIEGLSTWQQGVYLVNPQTRPFRFIAQWVGWSEPDAQPDATPRGWKSL